MDGAARRACSLLLALALAPSCAHRSTTYVFDTDRPPDESLDLIAKSLEQMGHRVARVDRSAAEIITVWQDTGQRQSSEQLGGPATLFVRYRVYVRTFDGDHEVRVSTEGQRCAAEGVTVTASEVIGRCEPPDRGAPEQHKALNELGGALAAMLRPEALVSGTRRSTPIQGGAEPSYSLHMPIPPDQAVRALAGALQAEGLTCAVADERGGALATTWRDSGYRVRATETGDDVLSVPSLVIRRYVVVVRSAGAGADARVMLDARRCEPPFRADLSVGCHDASQDRPILERDLAALGERLARRTADTQGH